MPEHTLEDVKNDVMQAIEAHKAQIDKERQEWKKHYEELKAQGAPVAEIKQKIENALRRLDELEAAKDRFISPERMLAKTPGEIVAESGAVKEFAGKLERNGHVRGALVEVPVKTFFPEFKTTITSTAVGSSTPGILVPERVPGIVAPGVRRNRVRDIIPRVVTTQNNAVEFVKESAFTNRASPQVEASALQESALTFTIDYEKIRLLGHWIPATRQVLDDFAELGAYINRRLLDGLRDEEDSQIISGDGTGQNLSGLTNEATAYDSSTYGQTNDTKIDKVARMIEQIEAANLTATGVIMHPVAWRLIQTLKTEERAAGTGSYLLGGPQGTAAPTLWGLPVATTTAIDSDKAIVGAFLTHVALHDRMQAQVVISTEHAEYFVKNMIAIRAEERVALTTTRSDAVIYASSF